MQVVNSENLVEFVKTGSVPEFKAPETADAPKSEATPATDATPGTAPAEPAKADAEKPKDEPARDEAGKFVKAGDEKPADDAKDDAEDADLPERVRRQIGRKHRAMREAEEFARERDQAAERERRRAETAERELERVRGGKSDGPGQADGKDEFGLTKPKQADFKTVGDFTEALVEYEGKKARAQGENQRRQSEANATLEAFGKRQKEFIAATPDYEEILESSDIQVPPLVQQYLIESDLGPQLAYHFAKNPGDLTRLHRLSPARQVAEVGKLEAKLESKSAAPIKADAGTRPEVSKAPAPIAPLETKTATINKDPAKMSLSELREFRRQEALAKQR